MGKKVIWQISWKEKRGGNLYIQEEEGILGVVLWVLLHGRKCLVAAIVKIEEYR